MVPKEQLGRVNGMMSLLEAGPAVFAPILAGALLPVLGVAGIMALDTLTFVFAVAVLFLVRIPDPERSAEGEKAKGTLVSEAIWGFKYIFSRPSLLGLQLMLLAGNFFAGFAGTVMAPMVLARTGTDALAFGGVQTVAAIGGVAGALLMSAWGGFKWRSTGVIVGWGLMGLSGIALGLGSGFWAWSIAMALISATSPLVNASNQSIWQSKVPPDLQGRVFSARRMIAFLSGPIVPLVAGPLADRVLEPAMGNADSALGYALGPVFGNGSGSGMSLLIFLSGLAIVAVAAIGWGVPAIRNAERILPDWDAAAASGGSATGQAADGADTNGQPASA